MWKITKQFDFCYGHRVWNQRLDENLAGDNNTSCKHLHGHNGKVLVTLSGDELVDGMIFDFKNLNFIKKFIDMVIDHKFIIDKNDPLFQRLTGQNPNDLNKQFRHLETVCYSTGYFWDGITEVEKELVSSFTIVDFVPTSENLSKWLYDIIVGYLREFGVKVESVEFFETPKSSSLYVG